MKSIIAMIATLFAVSVFAADAPKAVEVAKAPEVKVEAKKDEKKAAPAKKAEVKKDEAKK